MQYKFDIVIIGAGPAGLACARQFADSDFSVLIIDQHNKIGFKVCAGGIRVNDLLNLGIIPERIIGCDIFTFMEGDQKIDYTTIDRKKLSEVQLKTVNNVHNIKKIFGWRVTEILPRTITINNGINSRTIFFNYLVGADGSMSKVRQKLQIKTKNELLLEIIQLDLPIKEETIKYKTISYFYDNILFGDWYAYIFPHFNHRIYKVGCGGSVAWIKENCINLKRNFEIWLKDMKIETGGIIPKRGLINADYQGFDFSDSHLGKVYLCGDAAGLANYYSGEGIHQALVSGTEIGKIILNENHVPERLNQIISQKQREIDSLFTNKRTGKLSIMKKFVKWLV